VRLWINVRFLFILCYFVFPCVRIYRQLITSPMELVADSRWWSEGRQTVRNKVWEERMAKWEKYRTLKNTEWWWWREITRVRENFEWGRRGWLLKRRRGSRYLFFFLNKLGFVWVFDFFKLSYIVLYLKLWIPRKFEFWNYVWMV
jgi:hypothetical protein